jgi:hypothetical protein
MIRRAFWLGAGAAAGIMGYRRVSAMGRKMSGRLTGRHALSSTTRGALSSTTRGAFGATRETIRFTRDVREGMDLYIARHNGSAPPTLRTPSNAYHADDHDQKDGH